MDLAETKLNKMPIADSSIENSLISINQTNLQMSYEEEDSYINPSNVSKINQSGYNNQM